MGTVSKFRGRSLLRLHSKTNRVMTVPFEGSFKYGLDTHPAPNRSFTAQHIFQDSLHRGKVGGSQQDDWSSTLWLDGKGGNSPSHLIMLSILPSMSGAHKCYDFIYHVRLRMQPLNLATAQGDMQTPHTWSHGRDSNSANYCATVSPSPLPQGSLI